MEGESSHFPWVRKSAVLVFGQSRIPRVGCYGLADRGSWSRLGTNVCARNKKRAFLGILRSEWRKFRIGHLDPSKFQYGTLPLSRVRQLSFTSLSRFYNHNGQERNGLDSQRMKDNWDSEPQEEDLLCIDIRTARKGWAFSSLLFFSFFSYLEDYLG